MSRWDKILSLPVQNPPKLEFSAADLVWSQIEGWCDKIDKVAIVPISRADDFVRGESNNKECPTRFYVQTSRYHKPGMSCKKKVDGVKMYIVYQCSFGPDDHRKGGTVRPSRKTCSQKKKSAGRPSTKRGCRCHFSVKQLTAEPTVALIIYNEDQHIDEKGMPCHGPQDMKAAGTRAMYAPYISEELRLKVHCLLYVGVSVETIMQRHNESVAKQGGPCNRDDLMTHRYVRRQERSIRRSTYELNPDEAVSISKYVEAHPNHIFFHEEFSDASPFVLGIQTEWQLLQMIRFGNRSLLASDSMFGTNKLKYPFHSLVDFNSDNKAIPVAWIISPRFSREETVRWMRALFNRVHSKDPSWKLAGFVVDDPLTDIAAIREVFQCPVLISFWRVRHAWHKHLATTCSNIDRRATIAQSLGQAVHNICKGLKGVDVFEDFMSNAEDSDDFLDYFKAVWYPRLGSWVSKLHSLPVASQETCAAMEFYHNQLKGRLLNVKDTVVYQRADWLVDKLGTKVHAYFWLDEYSGKDDYARYRRDEWASGLTAWRKALGIEDVDVVLDDYCAKITDQEDRNVTHVIRNPGSEYAICDCARAEKGNLCEHFFKAIKFCRDKGIVEPSVSMFQFNRALQKTLTCPPFDSLVRDHAVSLAVYVQAQLNAQIGPRSSSSSSEDLVHSIQQADIIPVNNSSNENASHLSRNGSLVQFIQSGSHADELLRRKTSGEESNNNSRDLEVVSAVQIEPVPGNADDSSGINLLDEDD